MKRKISYYFDAIISLLIIFCAETLLFPKTLNGLSLYAAQVALAFSMSKLWLIILHREQTKTDFSAYLPQFVYRKNSENAKHFFEVVRSRRDCALSGCSVLYLDVRIIFFIRAEALGEQAAIDFSLAFKDKTLLIVSTAAPKAFVVAKKINPLLKIMTFNEYAAFLYKMDAMPSSDKTALKKRVFDALSSVLVKQNEKRFFCSSEIMAILAAVNGFSIYYLVFSAILFACGIICGIKGKLAEN